MGSEITVVGIGGDGWPGLPGRSRELVETADVLVGGKRHLAMLPTTRAVHEPWPSPLLDRLPGLLEKYDGQRIVVLASGDPLVSGIGSTLVTLLGSDRVEIIPAVSSVSLARARMNWSAESADVVSVVGRDHDVIRRYVSPGRRLVVLSSHEGTPPVIAEMLVEEGFGESRLVVFCDLDTGEERRVERRAADWDNQKTSALNVVCVECRQDRPDPQGRPGRSPLSLVPGLPDDAFEHDGQLTKRDVRTSALSRLVPVPGQLLWDVGAGAGSVAIEWLRADPRCRAIAVESEAGRVARITRNASRLGVPALEVRHASVPEGLGTLPAPDAVFVGGGASAPGVLDGCWDALMPGGRIVVHAVTLETEELVLACYRRYGGELTRLSVEHASPIGRFTGWSPARPIVQWAATKKDEE